MKFISKINSIFGVEKQKDAKGAEIWTVSWRTTKPYGYGCDFGETVFKAFFLEEDAMAYAKSLRDANNLLQNKVNIDITITKQN